MIARFAAALIAALAAAPALAQEPTTLRFAIPGSGQQSPTWALLWQPWIQNVEADSDGTLTLQTFFGATLANLFNVYDRVANGVAEMGTGVHGSVGGKFPGSSVVELPSDIGGTDGAPAFWKLYRDGLISAEYTETKPIFLFIYPQSFLNVANKPIAKLDDVKGLKIATLTRADAEVANRLGGAPVTTNPTEVYEMINRGGANGIIIGWLGLVGFKLAEVTNNHVVVGLGSGGAYVIANKDAYAKLPAKARAALDKHGGIEGSRFAGVSMDRIYANSERIVRGMGNRNIGPLAPAEYERYRREIVGPLTEDWSKRIPNGPAILTAYRGEVARLRAEKK
jgi:TRAP-type C4-dicarboxylate transport system substrate-binding protein